MAKRLIFVFLCTLSVSAPSRVAFADQPMPAPPQDNPHPPVTAAEKKSVAFAEEVIKRFLATRVKLPNQGSAGTSYKDKDAACLRNDACWGADAAFVADLAMLYGGLGELTETKHVHVVPSSAKKLAEESAPKKSKRQRPMSAEEMMPIQDDEIAVHFYGKPKNSGWHHVSLVLSINGALRRILIVPMHSEHHLPPGAKC